MNSESNIKTKVGGIGENVFGEEGMSKTNNRIENAKQEDKKELKLQFRFSVDAVQRLDGIVKKSRLVSRAELIRNAVRLYEYVIEQMDEGYEVELVKGRKRRKIVLLTR